MGHTGRVGSSLSLVYVSRSRLLISADRSGPLSLGLRRRAFFSFVWVSLTSSFWCLFFCSGFRELAAHLFSRHAAMPGDTQTFSFFCGIVFLKDPLCALPPVVICLKIDCCPRAIHVPVAGSHFLPSGPWLPEQGSFSFSFFLSLSPFMASQVWMPTPRGSPFIPPRFDSRSSPPMLFGWGLY